MSNKTEKGAVGIFLFNTQNGRALQYKATVASVNKDGTANLTIQDEPGKPMLRSRNNVTVIAEGNLESDCFTPGASPEPTGESANTTLPAASRSGLKMSPKDTEEAIVNAHGRLDVQTKRIDELLKRVEAAETSAAEAHRELAEVKAQLGEAVKAHDETKKTLADITGEAPLEAEGQKQG